MLGRFIAGVAGAGTVIAALIVLPPPAAGADAAAFIGMQVQGMPPEVAGALGMDRPQGVLVRDIVLGGPAAAAGFERGDVIVELGGKPLEGFDQLIALVGTLKPDQQVPATVIREGARVALTLKTGAWPESWRIDAGQFGTIPDLGLTLAALTDEVRQRLGLRWGSTGVVVTLVDEEKVKALHRPIDLVRGDIIVQVNQQPVWRPEQVLTRFHEAKVAGRGALALLVEGIEGARNGFRFSLLPVP